MATNSPPQLNFFDENIPFMDHIMSFVNAIDWSETWIECLVGFHLFTFLFVIFNRNKTELLSVLFFLFIGISYLSEYFNEWAISNWKLFSKQNYFERNGTFISFVFSLPLIINSLIILICLVKAMGDMLIKVKRAQLRQTKKSNETAKSDAKKDK